MRKQKISDKQVRFAQEYMIDSNATQAAIRAGYAKVSAKVSGHNCIINYNVKKELARLQANLARKTGFTIDKAQQMYLEDRDFASKVNQAGARVSATTGICRLYGMDKDGIKPIVAVVNIINYAGSAGVAPPKPIDSKEIEDVQE